MQNAKTEVISEEDACDSLHITKEQTYSKSSK